MALPHAQIFDVITVRPLGSQLGAVVSSSLIKTERIQLLHLVLPAHKDLPEHSVSDECTVHCIEGEVEVVTAAGTRRLNAGSLLVLAAHERHSLRARSDAAVLVTLLLEHGDASPPQPASSAGPR
jgi:quercetin dioxygenase-like cupin family protein